MSRLYGALLALLAATSLPVAADTLSREVNFDIDAGSLATALIQFSDQSGVQVVSSDASVGGLTARAVRGRARIGDALDRLLLGSALRYRLAAEDTIALIPATARPTSGPGTLLPVAALSIARVDPEPLLPALLDEVTVTAQKRPQSLQETTLSVTVVDAAELERRGITGLPDFFSGAVPSLRIASVIGRTSALTVAMRGINSGDVSQTSRDAGVGIYLDGIYLGRSQGLSAELLDVERIEVLRGPQGTLFGRNALGGAVNVISRRPSGRFALSQSLGVYSGEGRRASLHLDLPEYAGLSLKVDASLKQRDGLVDNPMAGAWDYGAFRRRGFRAQLAWRPGNDFEALYSVDTSIDDSAPFYLHMTAPEAGSGELAPMFGAEPRPVARARTPVPLGPSEGEISGHALTLSWRLANDMQLQSVSGWRSVDQSQFDNWAGASESFRPGRLFGRASLAELSQDQVSHELQLIGGSGGIEWIAGGYFFEERADDSAREFFSNQFDDQGTAAFVVRTDATGVPVTRSSVNRSRSRAVFGQATFPLPGTRRRVAATVGARHTWDDKHGELVALYGEPAPPQFGYRLASSRLDPSAALAFHWRPDVNLYLRWSTAYRAGGANSRSLTFRTFGPEDVRSWEAGVKSEFWDRRARLNVALYDMTYRHLQVSFFMPDNAVNTETVNTGGAATLRGVEADLTVHLSPRLRLTGSYSGSDVDIPPQVNPFTLEATRMAPVYAPRHAAVIEFGYDAPWRGPGRLMLHADAAYASGQYTYNSDTLPSPSSLVFNARIGIEDLALAGGTLSLAVWVRNAFDRAYELAGIGGPLGPLAVFGEGRSVGIDAKLSFGRH